jgi:predicted DNA-binding WGR domain protein
LSTKPPDINGNDKGADMAVRYFEFVGEDVGRGVAESAKFWEVDVHDAQMTIRFGKLGANGQTKSKTFPSASDAQAEADKLIASKVKKGYIETDKP